MRKEAFIYSRYLCGNDPSNEVISCYESFVHKAAFEAGKEKCLQNFIVTFPFILPVLDAALAFFRPRSIVRKKLLLMFALLECQPEHADKFMPGTDQNRGGVYLFFTGTWAIVKLMAGSIFLVFL